MNFGLLVPSAETGGIWLIANRLASALANLGHSVTIYVVTGPPAPTSWDGSPYSVVYWNFRHARSATRRLRVLLSRSDHDVIVSAQYYLNVLVSLVAPRRSRRKLFLVDHGTISMQAKLGNFRDSLMPFLMSKAYRRAQGLGSVSSGSARDLERVLGLKFGTVSVLPNPVLPDLEHTSDLANLIPVKDAQARRESPRIVFVGRLSKEKRVSDLVAAFDIVGQELGATLTIVGDGRERASLEVLAKNSPLSDRIHFTGTLKDPLPVMASSDVLVLCSEFEAHPVVLIEALSQGCAVVSTDCNFGPREILDGGRFGVLVPVGCPEKIAEGICLALTREVGSMEQLGALLAPYRASNSAKAYLDFVISKF